ncbi:hypothetical protein GOP47_0021619 [Adiantum capillus-veneris]|uniref:VQ domain-containing protein n=1 Tax=Adiantum capillus-veneris TaxID=13818 RepID=A0A9D4U8Q5_ADICA|nr:hypothetical protein GOP47_0021619 [Adiantum capillus-veneris]
MDASDGAAAAAQICTDIHQRAPFGGAARAPHAAETAFCEENSDDLSPLARQKDMEGESYSSKSLFAGDVEQMGSYRLNSVVEESYGSSKFLANEEGASAQNNVVAVAEESYESRRFLLSSSMASARAKKKRRSRASNKAPIKVFSTDTSNFMAMVHKLTGIPSNVSPFHSALPSPWTPKMLPFNHGLATLDTSALLLSAHSSNCILSSSNSYSAMQALPPQPQLSFASSSMKTASQAGHPPVNLDCMSASYSDLMRSMSSSLTSSSLPRLWEASFTSQKSGGHQLPQNSVNAEDGISGQEPSHQEATMGLNLSTSNTLSRMEMLLGGPDKLSSSSNHGLTNCIAKEELL